MKGGGAKLTRAFANVRELLGLPAYRTTHREIWEALARWKGVEVPSTRADGRAFVMRYWYGEPGGPPGANATEVRPRKRKARVGGEDVDVTSEAFLRSFAWRRLRVRALEACGGRCGCCGRSAADGVVINVDHVKPRRDFPELALDLMNLQVLCEDCNHGKGNWSRKDWRTGAQKARLLEERDRPRLRKGAVAARGGGDDDDDDERATGAALDHPAV